MTATPANSFIVFARRTLHSTDTKINAFIVQVGVVAHSITPCGVSKYDYEQTAYVIQFEIIPARPGREGLKINDTVYA